MLNIGVVASEKTSALSSSVDQTTRWQKLKDIAVGIKDAAFDQASDAKNALADFCNTTADKYEADVREAKNQAPSAPVSNNAQEPIKENNDGAAPASVASAAPVSTPGTIDLTGGKKASKADVVVSPLLKPSDAKPSAQDSMQASVPSAPTVIVDNSWNTTYIISGITAAAVVVGAIGYWYAMKSWHRAVDKLVIKAQLNPNAILEDLSALLEAWDGTAQQKQIIEYVEERVLLTPELIALLDLYRY